MRSSALGARMADETVLEVRLELYSDTALDAGLISRIGAALARRWPEAWDVKAPPHPTREHPAEWRAVVPLPDGATAETLHGQIESDILALDAARSLHFRTRWAFQESPDHQEIYEVGWGGSRR